jgi:SHS2 domain-containing protein
LNELNFLITTKKWLCLKVVSIKIIEDDTWELSAELNGIKGADNFQYKQEIKSVTYHQMEIVNKDGKFSTLVVFDI